MKTLFTLMRSDQPLETSEVELEERSGLDKLKATLLPLLDNCKHLERVTVLHNGERADMFVDEDGVEKRLPRNEAATTIYRHNWLTAHPDCDPESLAYICGPAVLSSRRIWW